MTANAGYLAEVFTINKSQLPELRGFTLDIARGSDLNTIGGKLAGQLSKRLGGSWAWSMTDRMLIFGGSGIPEPQAILASLWAEAVAPFGDLRQCSPAPGCKPSPQGVAEFVVNSLLRSAAGAVRKALSGSEVRLGPDVELVREPDVRAWELDGEPVVSLSIHSRLLCRKTLQDLVSSGAAEDILDMLVVDGSRQHTSEVDEVLEGGLGQHRGRLMAYNPRPEVKSLIENSPDSTIVVRVKNRGSRTVYEYPATALHPVVRTSDFKMFGVDGSKARKQMVLPPVTRARFVREAKSAFNKSKGCEGLFGEPVVGASMSTPFRTAGDFGFIERVKVGNGSVVAFDPKSIFREVKRCGPFLPASTRQQPLRLSVLQFANCAAWGRFQDRLVGMLGSVGCPSTITGTETLKSSSRKDFETAVTKMQGVADLLILVLPEDEQADETESGSGAYLRFKEVTIPRDFPSQAVQLQTLEKNERNDFVLENIALGIMSKAGAIPFVLADPLPYADVVVGLDIARKGKAKLAGSVNAAATARFFNSDGKFLRYWLPDHLIEGETIPKDVLERMFPPDQFAGKRILVHRDGRFRGDEKDALTTWGQEIGATMLLVEVIKSGAPRLYALEQNGDKKAAARPPKGLCLRMNDREAFLVSSLPPFGDATPQPLQVRVHAGITIEQACHSILALTLVHIGSKLAPRLPVTVHFADQIAELALKNIKPRSPEGDRPFWL